MENSQSQLTESMRSLHRRSDLDEKGQEILSLLGEDGKSIMEKAPEMLEEMVGKAYRLIGSPLYNEIIQKMVEIYQAIERSPKNGPMQCLVDQMENEDHMEYLYVHQEQLLSLIQILLTADDSTDKRIECLSTLIMNAQFTSKTGHFQWTEQFISVLKVLLQEGADPTWVAEEREEMETESASDSESDSDIVNTELDVDSSSDSESDHNYYQLQPCSEHQTAGDCCHSALYNFFQAVMSIISHENHLLGALTDLLPLLLTNKCLNHREPSGGVNILHALVSCDWRWLIEDTSADLDEQYQRMICKVVEANPALLEMTDDKEQSALHILAKAVYERPELGPRLLNILPILTTETNVNAKDRDSVTPYSWIMAGMMRHKNSNPSTFLQIEEMFLTKGADSDTARSAVHFFIHLILKTEGKELDHQEKEVLKPLTEYDWDLVNRYPELFLEVIRKAHYMLGSPFYLGIVQQMVEICQTIEGRPQSGPLQCLVEQMENEDNMRALCGHQEQLLSLIKVLMKEKDRSISRTKCFRILLLNALYGPRGSERRLQFGEELLTTLGLLLEGGADPTWIPEGGDGHYGSALYSFLHRIPYILVRENCLFNAMMALFPKFLTEQCLGHRDPQGKVSVLHALVDYDWDYIPDDLPGDLFEQYKGIICMVVEANPAQLDVTDDHGQSALHLLTKAVFHYPNLGRNLLNIFPLLATENNVNAIDQNLVSSYSWIMAGIIRQKNHLEIFSQIEELFLTKGADSVCAKVGLQFLMYLELNGIIVDLKGEKDLDRHGKEIVELLPEFGENALSREPELFLKMIMKANYLIGSPFYLQIIQNMVDVYMTISRKLHDEPLLCLVEQMEDYMDLYEHQEKLLPLIQTLRKSGYSTETSTRCLRALLLNAQYGQKSRGQLQWTEELVSILRLLMEGGADPSWIPQDNYYGEGSALYNFLKRLPLILAHNSHLYDVLMTILPRFLTEQCLSHREPRGTVVHALVDYDWKRLPEDLPGDFSEQYKGIICKVVKAKPALLDLTDSYGRNPLQCFIHGITRHKDLLRIITDIFSILITKNTFNDRDEHNVLHILAKSCSQIGHEAFLELFRSLKLASLRDIQDKNGQTVLHLLAGQYSRIGNEAFLELVKCVRSSSNVDIQDKDGLTVLHILAGQYSQLGHEAFLELIKCLQSSSNVDIENNHGQTVLHILAAKFSQIGHEAFIALVKYLRSPSNVDIQNKDGQTVLHILAEKYSQTGHEEFIELFRSLKLTSLRDIQDKNGQTVLHIRAEKYSQIGHKAFLELVKCLQSSSSVDIKNNHGQTVLHILAGKFSQIGNEAFLELLKCFRSSSSVDIQKNDGQTVLHILAEFFYEHPELGRGLLTIFPLLTTERNVNLSDNDTFTPFSWILVAKARWGNSKRDRKIFAEAEEIFLHKGADADQAKGPAFRIPFYRWVGQELSDKGCTSDRLELLLSGMKILPDGKTLPQGNTQSYTKEFKEAWGNLWRIRNAKCIPTVMDILRILVADKSTAQHAWTSMMTYSWYGSFPKRMNEMKLSVIEILCLCAERGAQPTDEELQEILERTNAMTRNDELTVAFLKTLVALHKNKPFTCNLQFLGDLYIVSPYMIKLGRQLVHAVYGTMDNCWKAGKLIDCLLFISESHEPGLILEERFLEDSLEENWFHRSTLHLAVMLLHGENSLKCLPQNIVKRHINAIDIHGCTPLHLAYLHHNQQAVQYLIDYGAEQDVTDQFEESPKSLESSDTTEDHTDIKYKELCHSVLEAKCKMRLLLIHSEVAAKALSDEVVILFQRLVRETQFETAFIELTGSIREKTKAGRLDEVDVLLKFKGERVGEDEFSIGRGNWKEEVFLKELFCCLRKRLAEISWEGINLRPISVHGPWKFFRKGMTVSLDVVALIVYEGEKPYEDAHGMQGELLGGNRSLHRRMEYCTLETWINKEFKPTYFAYEWDMIDSLPTRYRLAIVIGKALIQAYDWCRGDRLRVKMPITSYMIKTALFYMLAYNSRQLRFKSDYPNNVQALRNALGLVEGKKSNVKTRASKLEYNPQPKWVTDKDVDQHGKEAKVWVRKIFTLIKCLTQQKDCYPNQGWKLNSYWNRREPVIAIGGYRNESLGEAESICDVCDCALECLKHITF